MPIPWKITSLDEVDEAFRGEYVQRDGFYYADMVLPDGFGIEDVSGLKRSLGASRREYQEATAKLKAYSGIEDPAKALEAMSKLEEMQNFDPDEVVAEKIKAREEQLIQKHTAQIELRDKRSDSLLNQLKKELIENAAMKALAENGGAEYAHMTMPYIRDRVQLREADDKFIVEVLDDNGNPAIADSAGNPMGIPQLVAEMKAQPDRWGPAFNGTGNSGTNKENTTANQQVTTTQGGTPKVVSMDQMGEFLSEIAEGTVVVDPSL